MWHKIIEVKEWFGELADRYLLVKNFNRAAKMAFISGNSPTLLEAKITTGDSNYKHAFSKWRGGGFRIKALSGRPLEKSELIEIGRVVLDNEFLIREMLSLGWDTLEVHSNKGYNGTKWPLKEFANMGGFLD